MRVKSFLGLFLICTVGLSAQIRISGYFAGDYVKSEREGLYPRGTFHNPLIGALFSGDISPKINFMTEAVFMQEDGVEIYQAWLGLHPSPALNLRLGLYRLPFGQFNENNAPHQTLFINPPLNNAYLIPFSWRDIGVVVEGTISGFDYVGYIGNGLAETEFLDGGQQFRDNNKNKGYGGRIGFSIFEGLTASYSLYRGKVDAEDQRYEHLQAVSAAWISEASRVEAEYTRAVVDGPEGFSDTEAWGYYVQASIMFGNLQPVASYQVLDYADPLHGPGFGGVDDPGLGVDFELSRWTVGLIYSFAPSAFLKFEYDFNREKDVSLKNDTYLFQIAVSF